MIEDDPGPFFKIGDSFYSSGGDWKGPVVASPHAMYLVKAGKSGRASGGEPTKGVQRTSREPA